MKQLLILLVSAIVTHGTTTMLVVVRVLKFCLAYNVQCIFERKISVCNFWG